LHDGAGCIELCEVEIGRGDACLAVGGGAGGLCRCEQGHVARHLIDLVRTLVAEAAPAHQRMRPTRRLRHVLGANDEAHGPVAAWRHFVESERLDDRPGGQDVIQGQRATQLCDGVQRGVTPVLHRDTGNFRPCGTALMHVPHGIHGVPGDRRKAEDGVEVHIARGPHRRHGMLGCCRLTFHVDAERQRHLCTPCCDGVDRFVERHAPGHPVAEHFHDGAVQRQTQIIGHERRKVLLQRVGPAHREHERTDLLLGQASAAHCLEHQGCEDLVLERLQRGIGRRLQLAYGACRPADDGDPAHQVATARHRYILVACIEWTASPR